MASSTVITSALNDLQLLQNIASNHPTSIRETLKHINLSENVSSMCQKQLEDKERKELEHDHANLLEAPVVWIGDIISKRAKEIHSFDALWRVVADLRKDVASSLRDEICHSYYVFSKNLVVAVGKDDLMEFMDSVLENLVNFDEVLIEKLEVWKNFIRFVTLKGSVEEEAHALGPLLIHVEAVAIEAANLSYRCWLREDQLDDEIKTNIIQLLMKIIPVEPQVRETCVQALIAAKLSRKLLRDTGKHILKDFVDSLVCNFEEILKSGRMILSLSMDAIKDCVLLSKDMDHHVSSDLLEKIRLIETIIAPKCPESSSFDFPKTNGLGFVDSLLENMMDLAGTEAGSIAFMNLPIETIQQELVFLRFFLDQAIWDRVVKVAYRVEFLIDTLMVAGDVLDSSYSRSFHSIVEEIKIIKAVALNVIDSERLVGGKDKELIT